MLKVQTLSSGSGGNITLVGSITTNILVDIGLTLPQTLKRLQSAKINPKQIDAILITHEHSDHISGVSAFVKKYGVKIYCHTKCKKTLTKFLELDDSHFHEYDDIFTIGDITVNYFVVPHDSTFCFGYTFTVDDTTVGIATDVGKMTPAILSNLALCQLVILECNHDKQKLQCNTKYPYWLKRRIAGGRGHLSNNECANTVLALAQTNVSQIILAHISKENNSPTLAYTAVKEYLLQHNVIEGRDIFIDVAPQDTVGNVYNI